ncbi:hypothetical protein AVEN_182832-1 [Araneus ventricosus]|uniref:Uncharacterized protein n=1 Tax=Araneus ventricosus TaxID=182803 RepID=A0A4Y2S633_ARAVE|nr:hypothetical protein AVEN_182832-1 [Araneus ventricosus]
MHVVPLLCGRELKSHIMIGPLPLHAFAMMTKHYHTFMSLLRVKWMRSENIMLSSFTGQAIVDGGAKKLMCAVGATYPQQPLLKDAQLLDPKRRFLRVYSLRLLLFFTFEARHFEAILEVWLEQERLSQLQQFSRVNNRVGCVCS